MADVITIQELVDARLDAISLAQIINGAEWVEVETRLGRKCYTVATINAIITRLLEKEVAGEAQITNAVTAIINKAAQARLNIDAIVASLENEKNQILDDLQDAIDIAAAAGAGANGWTDLLIATQDGRTQRAVNAEFKENLKSIPYVNQLWQGALGVWSSGHALNVYSTQRKQIPIGITHARTGFGAGTAIFHVNGTYKQDAMRIQRTLGNTSTSDHNFVINLSFNEAKHLLGNTCCLAWHMFKGDDYAASSVNVKILGSDELEQPILRDDGLYSNGNVVISNQDFTIEERNEDNPFSLVFDVSENLAQIAVLFTIKFTNTTALADDYVEFEGIQLTQSDRYVKTLKLQKNDVLEKSMTRYQTSYSYGAPRGVPTEQGAIQMIAVNSNVNWAFVENIKFNPPMLIPPQFLFQSPISGTESRLLNKDTGANINGLAFNLSDSGVNITNNAVVVAGHRFLCHWTAQVIF